MKFGHEPNSKMINSSSEDGTKCDQNDNHESDGENDADSDTIMVMNWPGDRSRGNAVQAEAKPCRRCFYAEDVLLAHAGASGLWTAPSATGASRYEWSVDQVWRVLFSPSI